MNERLRRRRARELAETKTSLADQPGAVETIVNHVHPGDDSDSEGLPALESCTAN